ncbi:MAG: T9SS C-terminal target domain-containing protein, partial [Flavobacteriia bacterium]|nr:T9SS C-terminal target domain-containing protein [Flavobacteriia bacterium]
KEQLQLYFGGKDRFIELGVYASNGQLIDYQNIILPFGVRQHTLNTASYKQGVYIIKIKGETLDQSIQVIKE